MKLRISIRHVVILTALLAAPSGAQAAPLTVGQLMVRCGQLDATDDNQVKLKSSDVGAVLDAGKCWGHLEAYLDLATIQLRDPSLPNAVHPLGACPPPDLNFTQMIHMFLGYARSHPADFQKPAAQIVANLLSEKFPCRSAPR